MTDTAARMRQLIGTTAAWASNNIVLGNGEIGIEVVTSSDVRLKVGNGTSTWSVLPYASASSETINAATQSALDAKVALAGGTMTGLLILSGDPSSALGATTKQYVDAINSALTTSINGKLSTSGGTLTGALTLPGAPSSSLHAATKDYVDAADATKLSKSGDTMSGTLVLAADPANAMEAATKQYVDGGSYQSVVGGSAAYAGKVVKLNSSGLLDTSIVPVSATYLGTVNITAAYALSGTFTAGSYYSVSTSGTIDSSWNTKINGTPSTCGAGQLLIYNANTKWDLVGDTASSSAISGKLDKAGGTMTGTLVLAADPTSALHAATKQYADTMLPKAGGTMTGIITLSADPTSALHAATKQYVDGVGSSVSAAYAAADSALSTSLTTSINGKLSLAGGTMTGALVLAAAPTTTFQAANKGYVDSVAAGAALAANNLSDLPNKATARTNLQLGTSDSPQFASIELGAATDTSITRAAAGVMAVEGNRVPSPAAQAHGDVLYRGAANWDRLAAGTSGLFLRTSGAGANPVWGRPPAQVFIYSASLGTNTTFTIFGIPTGYDRLIIHLDSVTHNSTTAQSVSLAISADNSTYSSAFQLAPAVLGTIPIEVRMSIELATGTATKSLGSNFNYNWYNIPITNSITAIRVGLSSGNFAGGTITLYGVPY